MIYSTFASNQIAAHQDPLLLHLITIENTPIGDCFPAEVFQAKEMAKGKETVKAKRKGSMSGEKGQFDIEGDIRM